MKNFLKIEILLLLCLAFFNVLVAGTEAYSDTIRQNVKLESPDVYIYGNISKGTNIKFRNDFLYRILDNKLFNPQFLNSGFVEKNFHSFCPTFSFYGGVLFDKTPSENFGVIFQKRISIFTPHFQFSRNRIGYIFSGSNHKTAEIKSEFGVQSDLSYLSDISLHYSYYDYSFYNNTKNQLLSFSFSNPWIFTSLNKFNNSLSITVKGRYNYQNGKFNYSLIYQGFVDTLNKFVKLGIDTHLPEFAHNVFSIGFAIYPTLSYTPNIFASISMNMDNFGYKLSYSIDKNFTSTSNQFNENHFINLPRSFITNRKHHVYSLVYLKRNIFSIDITGEYFKADSLLIPIYTTSYLLTAVNNVEYYNIAIKTLYSSNKFNLESSISYNNIKSNSYSFEPDNFALNINCSVDIILLYSVSLQSKAIIGLLNKNNANISYPNAYGVSFNLSKSLNKNIKFSFDVNNLLNSYYNYTNIIPNRGRNFKFNLIFKI